MSVAEWIEYTALAKEAARRAGTFIASRPPTNIRNKGTIDFVSSVDEGSAELLRSFFAEHTPDIHVYAEEKGGSRNKTTRWIIDPLDGTTNFLHGFPAFCVSIALQLDNTLCVGVIYNPITQEMFYAHRGAGACCNGHAISCSSTVSLDAALLATGFPYDRQERADDYLHYFRSFLIKSRGIRRMGSAALDLANVACGRIDGFWEFGLQSWDVAAGALLIAEAGGYCTEMNGEPLRLHQPTVLAGTPLVWTEMKTIFNFSDII